MPGTLTRLAQAQLSNTIATLYTVPASTALVDETLSFFNDDTANRTITLYFVPSGQSAIADYLILESFTIYGKQPLTVQPKQRIDTGGTIRAFADVAGKVSCQIGGMIVNTATDTTLLTRLAQLQLSASLATPIYTATPNQLVDCAVWLYNFDTAPRTVILQFVPSGQAVALDYTLANAMTLQPKSGAIVRAGQRLDAGGKIYAAADVATKVACAVTGIQA